MQAINRVRRRVLKHTGTLAICLSAAAGIAQAQQTYPSQAMRIVVPYGPGGTGDVIARLVGKKLGEDLKQPVVVENKPGAAGSIGASQVARAQADGYTLLLGYTSEMVINPILRKDVGYDVVRDFSPIALAGSTPLLLVANPKVPARNIEELVALAREQPGRLSYATAGNGSPADIAGALLAKDADIDIFAVPYKGGSQAVADTVGGVVDVYFSGMPPAIPFVKSGRLNALGVTAKAPSPSLPDAPGLASGKYARLDLSGWFGFFVAKAVPAEKQQFLHSRIAAILQSPDVREALAMQGVETSKLSAAGFATFVEQEQVKYAQLIDELNISAQ